MSEISCPVCGIYSDADKEICPFCGAQLRLSQDESSMDYLGEEIPDWLKAIKDVDNPISPSSHIEGGESDRQMQQEDQPLYETKFDREDLPPESEYEEIGEIDGFSQGQDRIPLETEPNEVLDDSQLVVPSGVIGPFIQESQERNNSYNEDSDWLHEFEAPSDLEVKDQQTKIPEDSGLVTSSGQFLHDEEEITQPAQELPQGEKLEEDLKWLDDLGVAFAGYHPETGLPVSTGKNLTSEIGDEKGGKSLEETLPQIFSEIETGNEEVEIFGDQVEGKPRLVPADLPSWLKEMRPVEAVAVSSPIAADKELEKIESAGPLAGLKGILPAEPDASQSLKPKTYSVKLHVTDEQKYQSILLADMVKAEGTAIPIPASPTITSQHLMRIGIASLLFLIILSSLITGMPEVGVPAATSDFSDVFRIIESIQPGVPVLLAVDYNPAYSGEMDFPISLVINHLIRHNAYLTFVTSISTGAIQTERLLTLANQELSMPEQYTNLGFIPGGATGLSRFAQAPKQVLPIDIKGKPAWIVPNIQGVQSISDFSLLIVVTENPDIARSWIEQVVPHLAGSPIVMVVSAQAEPLIRPYYYAYPKQIQGFISGLAGGVGYTSLLESGSRYINYWPAYNLSMLFAGLFIAVGGIVNLALAYRARQNRGNVSGK